MIAADRPVLRPRGAKLLAVEPDGRFRHVPRLAFTDLLYPGDLVVANDAATLSASLAGTHVRTGAPIEVRLAGWGPLGTEDVSRFAAVVFGDGDFHTRTEDRPAPPVLATGDRLTLGPLSGTIERLLGHPRLVTVRFDGAPDAIWAGIAHHGRPIQYAHVPVPLALWDVWTVIAGPPVAFEPPSAGFAIDWRVLAALRSRGVRFATITHAAGISSTGDAELDQRLPLDEPYAIPPTTADAIVEAQAHGARIVAVGTTVVRALEHAAGTDGVVLPGPGLATQRINASSRLAVADAILTGIHEPGTSHYELLRAFVDDETLGRADETLRAHDYRMHEFGDSMFLARAGRMPGVTRRSSGDQIWS